MPGKLFLISTPIGNLGDLSDRAKDMLSKIQKVIAENPDHSRKLFQKFELGKKDWFKLSQPDEDRESGFHTILNWMKTEDVALISDAGSPAIQDPGARLVDFLQGHGVEICAIPGPSSPIVAIQLSGFWESKGFSFHGFFDRLPRDYWKSISTLPWTWNHVVFLTPHRGQRELKELLKIFPESRFCLGVELTKQHERVYRFDSASEVPSDVLWKGECVCVFQVAGVQAEGKPPDPEAMEWLWSLYSEASTSLTPRQFAQRCSKLLGCDVNTFYAGRFR